MAAKIIFSAKFGFVDLRKGLFGAKFDARADFDVRFAIALQKPRQISKNLISWSKISSKKKIGIETQSTRFGEAMIF